MNNNGTIHERIAALVEELGNGKNTTFALLIGSNEGSIRGYIKGIVPKHDFLEKIVRNTDVNPMWLLTGMGPMLRSDQEQPVPQLAAPAIPAGEDSFIYKMYEKEKEENKALIKENGRLEERIRSLEERISTYQDKEPDSPTAASLITEAFTSEPFGDSVKDSIHTRNPTMSLKKLSGVKT